MKTINETEGGLEKFSRGFEQFGFLVHDNGDITYREWAPNALRAYLVGDFSTICSKLQKCSDANTMIAIDNWNRDATPMTRGDFGRWEVTLPNKDGHLAIPHNSKVKVC